MLPGKFTVAVIKKKNRLQVLRLAVAQAELKNKLFK